MSGVSVATVSRVINNNGRFSEETRERVMKIIDEYNYTTNMAAKSLRISKSKTSSVIIARC
ncbi:MAG: LacI family DNA-binding transcriptional regulator [Romboutsia timonensis]